jgi:hypothetical protein
MAALPDLQFHLERRRDRRHPILIPASRRSRGGSASGRGENRSASGQRARANRRLTPFE